MPLEAGSKLGAYEIVSAIGSGSGAEVYKATDTQAGRNVAIQVIPPQWAGGTESASRRQLIERATNAVAALNHPNIRALHERGEQDGVDYVVLEYLEGKTLAERIDAKPMGLREALELALAIGDALDKAHKAGVVHRDLSPSNVMLTEEGAKLTDLGFAELRPALPAPASASSSVNKSAALAAPQSGRKPEDMHGLHYMAPELLAGKPADARTDIFAFGAVVYEMITGKKAFEGKSRAVLIAAIATADPDPLRQAQPKASRALEHVVQRCLEKDPDDRWQTVHDLLVQLRWIAEGGVLPGASEAAATSPWPKRVALAAAAVLIAALGFSAVTYLRDAGEAEALQFRVPVAGLSAPDVALSPDGQVIALVARPNTTEPSALYLRRMNSVAFLRLGGTDDSSQPFWSPDSRSIGFISGGRLKRVSVSGGAPKDICEAQGFFGGAWSKDGTILFGSPKGLFRVSDEGGKPAPVSAADPQESGRYWPSFLPDGKHFLYLAWSAQAASRGVFLGSLDSKDKTRLMTAESNAEYAAPGYVVFHREGSLFAQPFDAGKRALTGEPVHIADEVAGSPANGRGAFDVAQTGSLIYFQGAGGPTGRGQTTNAQFGWVDRTGNLLSSAGEAGPYGDIDLSPDGKQIAITKQEAGAPGADIWVIDWQRAAVATRLTLDPGDDVNPVWSPDGTKVAFTTYRRGNADIYVKNANNVGVEAPLLETPADESVKDWSKDGRFILYLTGSDNMQDIYALPLGPDGKPGETKPFPVVQGHFQKSEPQFSYDGKWVAYTSNETGNFQVVVMSFPTGDQKIQVSTAGAGQPRWRRDGKELYFRALDGGIVAVDIKPGPKLEAGVPHLLFLSPNRGSFALDPIRHQLSVTPDGQRFLLRVPLGVGTANPSGGGAGSGTPEAPPTASIQGATNLRLVGQITNSGLGPGGGAITTGLTVIQRWTALIGKGRK